MIREKVIDLVRKLITHEKSARSIGNIKEAEAFADRIQKILDSHKLGMSEIDWTEREQGEPIAWEHVSSKDPDFHYLGKRRYWQIRLAKAIALCNTCTVILHRGHGNQLFFVGRTSDRELCKVLFLYLLNLAYDLNERCVQQDRGEQKFKYVCTLKPWQDYDINAFNTWMRRYKASWFAGYSEAVSERFNERYRESRRQAEKQAAEGNESAIVHVEKDRIAIREHLKGKTSPTSTGRQDDTRSRDGYERGKRSGKAVNLSPNNFAGTTGRTSRLLA